MPASDTFEAVSLKNRNAHKNSLEALRETRKEVFSSEKNANDEDFCGVCFHYSFDLCTPLSFPELAIRAA